MVTKVRDVSKTNWLQFSFQFRKFLQKKKKKKKKKKKNSPLLPPPSYSSLTENEEEAREDGRILLGIYRHGLGNWLGLASATDLGLQHGLKKGEKGTGLYLKFLKFEKISYIDISWILMGIFIQIHQY